jgi:hypothetical protein
LIAFALFLEPCEHVGIDASGYLFLDGAVEASADGVLELLIGQFRDVAEVDFAVGALG